MSPIVVLADLLVAKPRIRKRYGYIDQRINI